jgi:hypothetical protein
VLLHVSLLLADPDVMRATDASMRDYWIIGRAADGLKALARAGVAALEDRPDDAVADFARAVEHLDAAGWHFVAAQARVHARRLLPAHPDPDAWAEEARSVFERLGAEPWLRLLEAAGSREAGTPATPTTPSTPTSAVGAER